MIFQGDNMIIWKLKVNSSFLIFTHLAFRVQNLIYWFKCSLSFSSKREYMTSATSCNSTFLFCKASSSFCKFLTGSEPKCYSSLSCFICLMRDLIEGNSTKSLSFNFCNSLVFLIASYSIDFSILKSQ